MGLNAELPNCVCDIPGKCMVLLLTCPCRVWFVASWEMKIISNVNYLFLLMAVCEEGHITFQNAYSERVWDFKRSGLNHSWCGPVSDTNGFPVTIAENWVILGFFLKGVPCTLEIQFSFGLRPKQDKANFSLGSCWSSFLYSWVKFLD